MAPTIPGIVHRVVYEEPHPLSRFVRGASRRRRAGARPRPGQGAGAPLRDGRGLRRGRRGHPRGPASPARGRGRPRGRGGVGLAARRAARGRDRGVGSRGPGARPGGVVAGSARRGSDPIRPAREPAPPPPALAGPGPGRCRHGPGPPGPVPLGTVAGLRSFGASPDAQRSRAHVRASHADGLHGALPRPARRAPAGVAGPSPDRLRPSSPQRHPARVRGRRDGPRAAPQPGRSARRRSCSGCTRVVAKRARGLARPARGAGRGPVGRQRADRAHRRQLPARRHAAARGEPRAAFAATSTSSGSDRGLARPRAVHAPGPRPGGSRPGRGRGAGGGDRRPRRRRGRAGGTTTPSARPTPPPTRRSWRCARPRARSATTACPGRPCT